MIYIQYNTIYFMVTVIGGNIFVNCIIIGVGEMIAGLISGILLKRNKDTNVFMCANFMVALSNTIFYFVPDGIPQYSCLLLTIFGVAT